MENVAPPGVVEQNKNIDNNPDRTIALQQLFGTDLEFLQKNGDLDSFAYSPESGQDGLLHTLIGFEDGGFHSESAVDTLQANDQTTGLVEGTFVDRLSVEGKKSKHRQLYQERLFEPYSANIFIRGVGKTALKQVEGSEEVEFIRNGMYPKEYDPTAIVRSINIAYAARDREQYAVVPSAKGDVITVTGFAPMLNGEARMPIRFFLDPVTEKIITAFPLVDRKGYMNLDASSAAQHLGKSATQVLTYN